MSLKETVESFDGKRKGTSKLILLVPIFVFTLILLLI